MKKLIFIILSVVMSCICFAKQEKIYVGTNAEFYPFEYLENEKISGFDIELMEKIGDKLNKKIEWKNMSFDGLLPALQSNKIDVIIAGMTATDERKKFVNFTDTYYLSSQMILINKKTKNIKELEDIKGKEVGVILGYTGDTIISKMDNVNVKRYNGASEAIMALKSNKINAVIIDSEPAKNYAKQNKDLKLINTDVAKEEYAIAISKKNKKLTEDINLVLKEFMSNGTYDELIKKYFN